MGRAKEPSVVTLLYFRGVGLHNAIRLEWATGTELHTVGFRIERSSSSAGPYVLLDEIGFVASEAPPDGLSGAEYDAIDSSGTANGISYWYRLVEIEGSGAENRSSPISVTAGLAVPTSTSTSTPTRTPTSISTAGPTALPGSSPTPVPSGQSRSATASPLSLTVSPNTGREVTPISELASGGTEQTDTSLESGEESSTAKAVLDSPEFQSTITGYPGQEILSTPIPYPGIGADGYPGFLQESDFSVPDAYPVSAENGRALRSQNSQYGASSADPPANIGRGSSPNPAIGTEQTEQEPAATLMLWVGFLAALVIFIAAVVGSAYIYRRQSPK